MTDPKAIEGDEVEASRAPLLDHLIELRRRLLWSVGTLFIAFFACYYLAKPIFSVLVQPLLDAGQGRLIFTNIFEAFFVAPQFRTDNAEPGLQRRPVNAYAFDRTGCRALSPADLRTFECGSRWAGACEKTVTIAQYNFGVSTNVHDQ